MEKIKSFVMEGRGGIVTLQLSTLAVLGGMFYAGINWKRDLEEAMKNRWSSVHMDIWVHELQADNPTMTVPDVIRTLEIID